MTIVERASFRTLADLVSALKQVSDGTLTLRQDRLSDGSIVTDVTLWDKEDSND